MLDTTAVSPRALLARRKPGYSLEQAFYTSPEIFDLDLEAIFFRTWIYVGVEPDVPDEGDVMVVDIGRASVVILRDDDGEIRAFHNVCRHRGARLIHEEKSSVGKLVCKYHAWTYDLDGKLLRAEHMGAGFDTSCHSLKPVHLKSVEGLLFICLADEPPTDIDELAAKMGPYLAPHAIRDTKVAHQTDLIELGNWKITMENNRECYHCAGNHPELTIPLFEYGFGFSPESMDEAKAKEAHRYECMVDDLHGEWRAQASRPRRSTTSTTASPASAPNACRSTVPARARPSTPRSLPPSSSARSPTRGWAVSPSGPSRTAGTIS